MLNYINFPFSILHLNGKNFILRLFSHCRITSIRNYPISFVRKKLSINFLKKQSSENYFILFLSYYTQYKLFNILKSFPFVISLETLFQH